jgi:hypothetical protein
MGDYKGVIPLPDDMKLVVDAVTMPTAVLGFVGAIPWSTVAAILASLYTLLRIVELVYGWFKARGK